MTKGFLLKFFFAPIRGEGRVVLITGKEDISLLSCFHEIMVSLSSWSSYLLLQIFPKVLQGELHSFGIKTIDIEPWFYRTPLLNWEIISKLINDSWFGTSNSVKDDYRREKYGNHLTHSLLFMYADPRNVIRDTSHIVEAMTSPEPETVYRCITSGFGLFFSIINDFLPWDVMFPCRRLKSRLPHMFRLWQMVAGKERKRTVNHL